MASPAPSPLPAQSSEEHQAWSCPQRGGLQRALGMGGRGTLTKDVPCAPSLPSFPPALLPSYSTSYIGSSSRGRMDLNCCLGGDEIAKCIHRPSRSSPVRRHRAPEQPLPTPRPPAPPHPPPAVPVSPREDCCHLSPAATGSPPPARSPASAAPPNPRLCVFPGAEVSATVPRSERVPGTGSPHGDQPAILTLRTPRQRTPPGWDSPTRSYQGAKATATQEFFIQINKNELLCTNIQNHYAHFIK